MCVILIGLTVQNEYDKREMEKSLSSILESEEKPTKVLISYFSKHIEVENDWSKILENIDTIFVPSKEEMGDFTYFKLLEPYVENDDTVMFLRKGDFYARKKISEVKRVMRENPYTIVLQHDWYGFFDLDRSMSSLCRVEKNCMLIPKSDVFFWSLVLTGREFKSFFRLHPKLGKSFEELYEQYGEGIENVFCDTMMSYKSLAFHDIPLYYYKQTEIKPVI